MMTSDGMEVGGFRSLMRKRLRKKRHREYLTTVCAYVVTFDDGLRSRLLRSEPGTPFPIDIHSTALMKPLIRGHGLRYWVKVGRMIAPTSAVVVYWADEFPSIRDEAVIFSAAELGLTELLGQKRQEQNPA